LLPRECETANCFEALEADHNFLVPVTRLFQDERRRYLERAIFFVRAPARLRSRPHQSCKHRKPTHSKAMPVAKDSHDSDQYSRRGPPSQPNITTSPVSRPRTTGSPRQSSSVSRCRKYSFDCLISTQILPGNRAVAAHKASATAIDTVMLDRLTVTMRSIAILRKATRPAGQTALLAALLALLGRYC
jgi:hypothetical protein